MKKLCAVYGSLKKGYSNHDLFLGRAKYVGKTITEPRYTMYSLGGFPGVIENGDTAIHLEVYEVTEEEDREIESLEGYREETPQYSFYLKKEINTKFGKASIYIFNKKADELPVVKTGNW
jgi:gamma-glutamylcyclotransferase (GGCT)/AIG2-like uncharacterized protein YtfP